ncbi:ATP-binding protein [Rhizobium sp.]|uniref:sensor histidine kinase n=1 Tax=Rhizobium sp. TaxID=391 RepID=UPI0028A918CE
MLGGNFFKSTAVRLAIIYSSLFVVSYLGANVIAYQMVLAYLDDRLDKAVMERYREIETTFRARGLPGAVDMINSHGPAILGQETIYTLRSAAGEVVAGNADLGRGPDGFFDLPTGEREDGTTGYKVFRGKLGENELAVGISEGDTEQLARIVLVSFGWTTAIVFAVALAGGAVLRYRARSRINELSQTAHAIGHGELSRRLPVSPRMDEIDVLSSEVNVALARLEASVASLKQVTADIAHDLKTPVSRAFLALDDALQLESVDEVKEAVGGALQELSALAATFDALLRIAQIESRSRTARFAAVNLADIARDMHETYEVIASEEGRVLTVDVPAEPLMVFGDEDLVRQMIANLLANTVRHTPDGSHATVAVAQHPTGVVLEVTDNGPGIPESERARVLERFYRLEKSRTTIGSGLGLSMVKAICDLHMARLELLDNSPGLKIRVVFQEIGSVPVDSGA